MKNLKKVLSLALAFAMVLGLCVTGMAAQDVTTLSDWDEVSDKDAVLLLNAFDIMQGHSNGTFNAEGNVTRAQAATMLAKALWGGVDKSDLFVDGNIGNYTDVVLGQWYMGPVNYVTAVGVMTGKNIEKGIFDPNGNVTGYELLKMCLVALGYNPGNGEGGENLVGTGWDIRTMVLATAKLRQNLTEGTTVTNWSAPLSRMNAAIILKNMINREMVEYTDDGLVTTNDTFGEELLGMEITDGVLVANEYGATETKYEGKVTTDGKNAYVLANVYDEDGDKTGTKELEVSIASDLTDLGTSVQVYLSEDEVVFAAVTGTEITPADDSSNLDEDALKTQDYTVGTTGTDDEQVTYLDTNADGKGDTKVTVNYKLAKVTAVVETENFGTLYGLDKCDKWVAKTHDKATTDIANMGYLQASTSAFEAEVGDWVAYNTVKTATKDVTYNNGYVLEAVEGKITRVAADKKTVTINGVTYGAGTGFGADYAFGTEGIYHVYANGTIGAYTDTGSGTTVVDKTYAVVFDVQVTPISGALTTTGTTYGIIVDVAAVLENGTTGIYEVAKITNGEDTYTIAKQTKNDGTLAADAKDGTPSTVKDLIGVQSDVTPTLVQYTLNDDGTINLTLGVKTNDTDYNGATPTGAAELTSKRYLTTSSVTFFKNSNGTWTVVEGLGLNTVASKLTTAKVAESTYLSADTMKVDYALVTEYAGVTATPVTGFFYLVADNGLVGMDGTTEIHEVVVFDGKTNTVDTIEVKVDADFKVGTIYTTLTDSVLGGGIVDDAKTNFYTGYISALEGDVLALGKSDADGVVTTNKLLTLNKDTKYYLISGEDSATLTVDDLDVQDAPGYKTPNTGAYQTLVVESVADDSTTSVSIVIVYGESIYTQD